MPRKPRTAAGLEIRGEGPYALLAAVVLQAVADLEPPEWILIANPGLPASARAWLNSEGCAWALEWLDLDYEKFMEAVEGRRLRQGTSTRAFWDDVEVA